MGGGNSLIMNNLQNYDLVITSHPAPNTPAIRFRGYTEPWQQKRLGDFGIVSMCKRVMKYQTTEKGDIPFYKIGTFGGTPDAYISLALFLELKKKYAYPQKGDILLSAAGTIGRTVRYSGNDEYFQDSNIVWLQHNGKLNNDFLYILYSTIKWNSLEGSTLKRLYNGNLLATSAYIPFLSEQQQIGNFFRTQDEQIAHTARYITSLRTIRTALLQKMFV